MNRYYLNIFFILFSIGSISYANGDMITQDVIDESKFEGFWNFNDSTSEKKGNECKLFISIFVWNCLINSLIFWFAISLQQQSYYFLQWIFLLTFNHVHCKWRKSIIVVKHICIDRLPFCGVVSRSYKQYYTITASTTAEEYLHFPMNLLKIECDIFHFQNHKE